MNNDNYYLHFPNGNVLEDVDLYRLSQGVYMYNDSIPLSTLFAQINKMDQKPNLYVLKIQVGGVVTTGEFY